MEKRLKIIIPGGSGQVGTLLARAFHAKQHEVIVLSRRSKPTPWRTLVWDAKHLDSWADEFNAADAVINLAGKNVNCRYTPKNQKEIMRSRIDSTTIVGQAIAQAASPPRVWLQSSTATIYSHRFDESNDELSGTIGGKEASAPKKWGYSIEVAKAWEATIDKACTPNTRKLKLRSAMIMSPDSDGIFDTLLRLVRFGLGGNAANGKQYVSWIHEYDFINALYWLIEDETLEGVFNLSAPEPLPYSEFMKQLRESWGSAFGLPATKWMLEVGTFLLRTETELILKSRRVIPTRLEESGFNFEYAQWKQAANELCQRWKNLRLSSS